ncbi:MAG: phenylalanine--tRNA ligase subunit beta [Candidatus Igneacidithiobacillus chanchocoensis]
MRVPLEWLREFLDTDWPAARLADTLSMSGLEVEAVEPAAPEFSGVVVGEVRRVWAHPAADKLRVAEVAVSADATWQIVCGAANLREGQRVAAALAGARLPGMKISNAELRGVASQGMLCSAKELGMEDGSAGILELDADSPVGADLRAYLKLDDPVLTLGITPNRGDALSILGVARDLAARGAGRFLPPVFPQAPWPPAGADASLGNGFALRIAADAQEACGTYSALLLTHLPERLPDFWRERLRRTEQKCISPLVDYLNAWMIALGQPMHAFDADTLHGGIEVRWARAGEVLDALDGRDLPLAPDMLVIADQQGPVALAGIIGGRRTAVSAQTQRVLLEAAYFSAAAVQGRARRLGLQTEAAQRYERGVDFRLALPAALALQASCAMRREAGVTLSGLLPDVPQILLRRQRIARILGAELAADTIPALLQALGCHLQEQDGDWRVNPPSHRYDLRIEADLIEELGRLSGYENLPSRRPQAVLRPLATAMARLRQDLLKTLIARDYHEIITYSFVAEELQGLFSPGAVTPRLQNPISADLAVMRASLWPGLLQTLRFNANRQQDRLRFFEFGRVFADQKQQMQLAGVLWGSRLRESWVDAPRDSDFYDLKGDVEALLSLWPEREFRFARVEDPALHPGQSAQILWQDRCVGRLGALHPRLLEHFGLGSAPWLFSLDVELLLTPKSVPFFRPLSPFPLVQRDLALAVPDALEAGRILEILAAAGSQLVQEIRIFDRYRGDKVPTGHYGLGLRLQFQAQTSTLLEAQVQEEVERLLHFLQAQVPVALRV